MTATATAAVTFDLTAMLDRHGLKTTHALLTALAGRTVEHVDAAFPSTPLVGTLRVGEWNDAKAQPWMGEFARDGFTLNVDGANGDFLAAGVWSDDDRKGVESYLACRPVLTVR